MIKIPTKSRIVTKHIVFIQNFFFSFALERNNFRIMAFCDEIFNITFVTTVAKIFADSFLLNVFQT